MPWVASAAAGCVCFAIAGCAELELRPGSNSILSAIAPPTPEEAARMAIDPYDADKRYRGTQLLSGAPFAGERVYLQLFTDNAQDKDPGVRAAALRGLGMHGSPEHAPIAIAALKDTDPGVRAEAARALQRIHDPESVDALVELLSIEKEPEPDVRVEAARALGQYPQRRVVEKLIAALADDGLAFNRAVQSSLRTLTGQDFGLERAAWAAWYKDAKESEVFAAHGVYTYYVYQRDKKWYEYLPFVPPPPNEPAGTPSGMPIETP